jgi:hypothetical protein
MTQTTAGPARPDSMTGQEITTATDALADGARTVLEGIDDPRRRVRGLTPPRPPWQPNPVAPGQGPLCHIQAVLSSYQGRTAHPAP